MKPFINRTGILFLVIIAAVLLPNPPTCGIYKKLQQAALAETISKSRHIKLTLDAFAMDNNGVYPNAETARFYETSGASSNALFHQLFASANTNSEQIFWIKGHPTWCNPTKPNDITTARDGFDLSQTLQPGDNGFSYVYGLTTKSPANHPLLFPALGSGIANHELWNGRWFLLTNDGSIVPLAVSKTGTLATPAGQNPLDPSHPHWHGTPPDIRKPLPPKP